tara:strand:+ start:5222 stop:5509 length:288 start_codon:yes stop_codon:yes gene_type:complete
MKVPYIDILRECSKIAQERGELYGEVTKNFTDIRDNAKAMFGMELSIASIIELMIATKFSRQKNEHKDDNLIDIINYTAMLLWIKRGAPKDDEAK